MTIWVDADACPTVLKEILIRAAQRTKLPLCFIANQYIAVPNDANITSVRVSAGFDVADDEIVKRVEVGDLVITNDLPLAAEIIEKDAIACTSRGETLDRENIRARLNMRDFFETLRSSGIQSGGPSKMTQSDRQAFAAMLDKYVSSQLKNK